MAASCKWAASVPHLAYTASYLVCLNARGNAGAAASALRSLLILSVPAFEPPAIMPVHGSTVQADTAVCQLAWPTCKCEQTTPLGTGFRWHGHMTTPAKNAER